LAAELGADDADQLRLLHFGLLRRGLAAHGGREVKNLGDGLMVVFDGAAGAIDAAIAMQQLVDGHNRERDCQRLSVRIGVAAGDCVEEHDDYFGEPVVQAARLCASAGGGEILATAVTGMLAPRGRGDDTRPLESIART
jgi:class 3 adenylate cyclase